MNDVSTTSAEVIFILTLKMTSAQVVETSVINNSYFQNYYQPDDHNVRTTDIKKSVNVICLPTLHQGAQRTRSNVAVHSEIELKFGNVGF